MNEKIFKDYLNKEKYEILNQIDYDSSINYLLTYDLKKLKNGMPKELQHPKRNEKFGDNKSNR